MPRAKRICPTPGCPHPATALYCTEHQAEYEAKRGTKAQRGYGKDFQSERKRWARRVATGGVHCWRCGTRIEAGAPFDLGHNDDRTKIIGPEHPTCNRSAAGRAAHPKLNDENETPPF